MNVKLTRLALLSLMVGLAVITTGRLGAAELAIPDTKLPEIDVHGFFSQGFLYSSDYDYLGESSNGSFEFTEAGLNASFNPFPRTRIAAQEFTYDVGPAGDYDVVLDYAFIEYTFNDHFGIRGGRIRRPEGLYNDIQDVDLARTWVLLPQGMYNARWRDFYVSEDGAEIFGTFSLNKAGSLSYELYDGAQHPKLNGGLALQKSNLPPYSKLVRINSPTLAGGQIWWITPLDGLKAGLALNYDHDLTFINAAGRQSVGSPITQHYSLEYLRDSWTFQAEYLRFSINYLNTLGGMPPSFKHIEPDTWYVSAAYRFNRLFEAGAYYTTYCANVNNRDGVGLQFPSDANQGDTDLSLRFDVTPWWILKIEGHYIKGTAQLLDVANNPVRQNNGWGMLAVKTTFSF